MNKLLTPLLILTIVGLFGLVFYVKKNAQDQAKEYVRETMDKVEVKLKADKALREGNNILWELALETALNKPDRKEFIIMAKRLQSSLTETNPIGVESIDKGSLSWRVSHSKAGFTAHFSKAGNFESLDVDELLGKTE